MKTRETARAWRSRAARGLAAAVLFALSACGAEAGPSSLGGGGAAPTSTSSGEGGLGEGGLGGGGEADLGGAGGGPSGSASTTGSGPAGSCDVKASCGTTGSDPESCVVCAQAGPCAATTQACVNAPGNACVDLLVCSVGCDGDAGCLDHCGALYPGGVEPLDAYLGCVLCDACPSSCPEYGAYCGGGPLDAPGIQSPADCNPLPCDQTAEGCLACAVRWKCHAESSACQGEPTCAAFGECLGPCGEEKACQDACSAKYPDGAAAFAALYGCLLCDACGESCGGVPAVSAYCGGGVGCASDAECAAADPEYPYCLPDGTCGDCKTDADCKAIGLYACVDGYCE